MTFRSDAPNRTASHVRGCAFGPGFYKVTYSDGLGKRATRHFDDRAASDLFVSLLPPTAEPACYRDGCLDTKRRVDAGTPDTLDAAWWLALPRAQAMEEAGLTEEADYARAHRALSDVVAARENRETQGGVRASVVLRRKRRPHNAHLFAGGRLIDLSKPSARG